MRIYSCGTSTCVHNRTSKTNIIKYGAANTFASTAIKDKIRNSNLNKYGAKSPLQNKEIMNKMKNTLMHKYGVANISQIDSVIEKKRKTFNDKYGTPHPLKSTKGKLQIQETNRKNHFRDIICKYNHVIPLFNEEEYVGVLSHYMWKCRKCGNEFEDYIRDGHLPVCKKCNPVFNGTSNIEKEIQEWICSIDIRAINNKKFIHDGVKYELDIFIPDLKIGIEIDGLYWHSESKVGKTYHRDKTIFFMKNYGIQVIHVFENEWHQKKDIVKSIIQSKLGINRKIYARNTNIVLIDSTVARSFLDENHIQGYIPSSIRLGLYHNNELSAVATFGKSRYNRNYEFELLRFSTTKFINVVGGFSKMIMYFIRNYTKSLISYVDLRYFDGHGYIKNGFKPIHVTEPNYFYFNNNHTLHSRIEYQKHKLKSKLSKYNDSLTEYENMANNGYSRIYDCGNMVVEFSKCR